MSSYTDKILEKIQREQRAKEEKETQLEQPFTMTSSDDADMDFDFDSSVSDSEFSESFFNDEAHGEETQIDLDEPDDEIEEATSIDELIDREIKDKKKKRGRTGEIEEQELKELETSFEHGTEPIYIYSEELTPDTVPGTITDAITSDNPLSNSDTSVSTDTRIDIIDTIAQDETYEQMVIREQEEQEKIITSSITEDVMPEKEFSEQPIISDAVISSVVSNDTTEQLVTSEDAPIIEEPLRYSAEEAIYVSPIETVITEEQTVTDTYIEETDITSLVTENIYSEDISNKDILPIAEEQDFTDANPIEDSVIATPDIQEVLHATDNTYLMEDADTPEVQVMENEPYVPESTSEVISYQESPIPAAEMILSEQPAIIEESSVATEQIFINEPVSEELYHATENISYQEELHITPETELHQEISPTVIEPDYTPEIQVVTSETISNHEEAALATEPTFSQSEQPTITETSFTPVEQTIIPETVSMPEEYHLSKDVDVMTDTPDIFLSEEKCDSTEQISVMQEQAVLDVNYGAEENTIFPESIVPEEQSVETAYTGIITPVTDTIEVPEIILGPATHQKEVLTETIYSTEEPIITNEMVRHQETTPIVAETLSVTEEQTPISQSSYRAESPFVISETISSPVEPSVVSNVVPTEYQTTKNTSVIDSVASSIDIHDVFLSEINSNIKSIPDTQILSITETMAVSSSNEAVNKPFIEQITLSTIIDDIVADKATEHSSYEPMSTEKNEKAEFRQESYSINEKETVPSKPGQELYITQTSSNVSFDTRAAVVDMVADEQIKPVTEAYTSPRKPYLQEFSPEVRAVLENKGETATVTLNGEKSRTHRSDKEFTSSTQENDIRDIVSDKEKRKKDVSDVSIEQTETEKKQSAFKEQALHQFAEAANGITRQINRTGEAVVSYFKNEIETADENTKAGFEDLKKFTKPIAETATVIGMAALAKSYSDDMNVFGKVGSQTDKLIKDGKLSVDDLKLSKEDLNKRLKDAGVSKADRKEIIKNRSDIHDMMGVRSEMQSMVANGQMRVDEKTAEFIKSGNFFDLRNEEMGKVLRSYFKNSPDDTIRNVFGKGDFTGKSAKNFRKFRKKAVKNEVSANGMAAVKMAEKAAFRARANRELFSHLNMKLIGSIKSMVANVTSYDKNTAAGMRTLSTAMKISAPVCKAAKKVFIGTRRHGYKGLATESLRVVKKIMIGTKRNGYKGIATQIGRNVIRFAKYTDKSFYTLTNHSIGHFISVSKANIRKGKQAVKAAGELAKQNALVMAKKTRDAAANTRAGKKVIKLNNTRINATNKAIAKYKETQRNARLFAQKMSQTKAAKVAYATGNAVAKGADIFIGTPFRFGAGVFRKVNKFVGKIFNIFRAIKKFLMFAVGGFCAIYIALVLIVMMLLSIFEQGSMATMNVLLAERDEFITESIDRYLQKSEEIKDAAIEVGEGTPITPEVTSGHTIDKYGHPDTDGSWVQGYKIYYTDSAGNIIQDGSNNVKDTMVLAYVQMDADWENENNATDIMDRYFKWLNPNSNPETLLENSEESDIYFCADGCETVYYKCNDSATLTNTNHAYMSHSAISTQAANGTKFYGTITSHSGDYYTTQCYGHYIPYTGVDAEGNPYTSSYYVNHGSGTNSAPSGCNNYSTSYYCTGHSIKACYGHRDVTIYIPIKTMDDAFSERYMASGYSFLTFLNGGTWEEDDIDWCWSLYNADWYDLYGIDPSGGVGFTAGGSMTAEEIDAVLANCGNASQVRQNIISVALSQVGSLPYYYGGKPTSGGLPIMTNRGQAGSPTNIADHIGRTTAGLDCFGFCQWVYWNVTGSNVMPEGSAYTTKMVFNSTSCGNLVRLSGASELQIGDLGFMDGHVGIFAGVNENGQLMWIHCTGSSSTVNYEAYTGFTRYYRLNGLD